MLLWSAPIAVRVAVPSGLQNRPYRQPVERL